jgi:uncharacterized protein YijF (DUF1287 family)
MFALEEFRVQHHRTVSVLLFNLLLSPLSFADKSNDLIQAAHERTHASVTYNGTYFQMEYPNGDVPQEYGVCTDVVIRSYRKLGIDLQQLVHEDMRDNFSLYPAQRMWNQTRTDRNIDHRRVPNLQVFFTRHGSVLPITNNGSDYQPGDLVTWMLGGKLPHIGIVVDGFSRDGERPLIVHNVGAGPALEDVLFSYPITGHYRFGLN